MKRNALLLSSVAVIGWVALMGYVLQQVSMKSITEAVRSVGSGVFLVVLALSGLRQCLRAVAWRCSLDTDTRPPGILKLLALRLIGESAVDLTPAGSVLGETVRAWAAAKTVSATFGVASVIIEDLAYALATALFVLLAMFVFLAMVIERTPVVVRVMASVPILAAVVCAIGSQKSHAIEKIAARFKATSGGQRLLGRYGQTVRGWLSQIRTFCQTRRKLFLAILSIELGVNLLSLAETYLIIKIMTSHASLLTTYLLESASRCAQIISACVPLGLGVDEGVAALAMRFLGSTLREGVSVAVIRKIRSVLWDLVGLLLAVQFLFARRSNRQISEPRSFL